MQLAIFHYHLNRGGVARVIENHLLALAEAGARPEQVLVLHGGRADDWPHEQLARQLPFPLQTQSVAGLDYDSLQGDSLQGDSLQGDSLQGDSLQQKVLATVEAILAVLDRAQFERVQTLLHWHNHALGKNVAIPLIAAELARRGYHLLLQIHDFAEDLRPDNYRQLATALAPDQIDRLPDFLYPQAPAIHYAVLNGRDRQLLSVAGVHPERLHLVPNPVSNPTLVATGPAPREGPVQSLSRQAPADRARSNRTRSNRISARQQLATLLDMPVDATWITYPVRGIRRKNIGEMLLWSAAASVPASRPAWLHVTIAPQNPLERASFDRWQQLAKQLDLPCRFGTPTDDQVSYEQVLAACDLLLTTSVAEGFGMVFLECWLAGKQLLGRDLPEITTDFKQAGICLDSLTPRLAIPAAWVDRTQLVQALEALYRTLRTEYGQPPMATTTEAGLFEPYVSGPTIDFARLPARMQADIIRRVHGDPKSQNQLRSLNRQLDLTDVHLDELQVSRRIDTNRKAVGQHYSLARVGDQLATLYTRLLEIEPSSSWEPLPRGQSLLDTLLRPDRLLPIRIEP